jgi:hypothetical protein
MKLPWQKQEPEFFVEERPKKPRETLTQTADKLIQRKMKRDPDGYGLQAAEKIKGINRPEPKTVREFLAELREYRAAMNEAGLEGGAENKGLLQQFLEVLPSLPALLAEARQFQQGMPQNYQQPPPEVEEKQREQLQQPKLQQKPKSEPLAAPLPTLVELMSLTPQEAFEALKSEPGWLGILKDKNPDELVAMIQPLTNHREQGQHVQVLIEYLESENGKNWLEELTNLIKNA